MKKDRTWCTNYTDDGLAIHREVSFSFSILHHPLSISMDVVPPLVRREDSHTMAMAALADDNNAGGANLLRRGRPSEKSCISYSHVRPTRHRDPLAHQEIELAVHGHCRTTPYPRQRSLKSHGSSDCFASFRAPNP